MGLVQPGRDTCPNGFLLVIAGNQYGNGWFSLVHIKLFYFGISEENWRFDAK
jgi:hypothetical protein